MILTKEIFDLGKSSNNGWNKHQLALLGVGYPLPSGWMKEVIGADFPSEVLKQFVDLKDSHFKEKLKKGELIKKKVKNKIAPLTFSVVFDNIPYKEQYLHPNWQKMRLYVFDRDKYTCVDCKSTDKTLHAHHLKYIREKMVWEVPHWYLVTLCEDCHKKEHNIK
tara:strand:+ start:336 stop:827 length:492 start_codon:yes stop_codon:yes gene_type:complete